MCYIYYNIYYKYIRYILDTFLYNFILKIMIISIHHNKFLSTPNCRRFSDATRFIRIFSSTIKNSSRN